MPHDSTDPATVARAESHASTASIEATPEKSASPALNETHDKKIAVLRFFLYRPGGAKGPKKLPKKRLSHTANALRRLFTPAKSHVAPLGALFTRMITAILNIIPLLPLFIV